MNRILKTLNIVALIAIAFFGGRAILTMEKQKVSSGHDHGEHGGHGGDDAHGGHAGHDEHAEHGEHGEGMVELSESQIKAANIVLEEADSSTIRLSRTLYGKVRANEERLAHITPRFPGIVTEVRKRLGDAVEAGETLVVIESNESLQTYEVKSLTRGTVTFRDVNAGEAVTEGQRLLTVADLSTVWVDLNAYPEDYRLLKIGQPVTISGQAIEKPVEAAIDYISPFGVEGTQTMLARATIENEDGMLRPGLFVQGRIHVSEEEVMVAVRNAAIQTWEDETVVFVQEEHGFKATPVRIGKYDEHFTEVIHGLLPGEKYASDNSFMLKAHLGKDMAAHEH